MPSISAGFWSYVHADDKYESGRIIRLRERLEQSIRFHSGISGFQIFLDKKDIGWGQHWEERIKNSLNDALMLFPIITPSYFASVACREEFLVFQERQEKLGRDDLVLPIYYLTADVWEGLHDRADATQIEVAQSLLKHQYEDFRSLRSSEETDPSYSQAIERLGQKAYEALKRSRGEIGDKSAQERSFKLGVNDADETLSPASEAPNLENETPGHITSVTVNQMPGRAQFTSIVDAVARAPGGARIIVHPGHYREKVVIDKPLELIGNGNVEDIVIESKDGEPLTFDTNIGLVRNFTIRQTKAYDKDTEFRDFGVWIKQGRLELEDCDISSSDGACVFVSKYADPRIRRNKIHNGRQSGIAIFDSARGTFEDNEIFGNSLSGMIVSTDAHPIVRRNRSYGNAQSGLYVHSGGEGSYEDNEFFENNYSGVSVKEAKPILRRNRIYGNFQSGVRLQDGSSGVYEDNEIRRNRNAGIQVNAKANPVVRRNHINSNGFEGIWIRKDARGSYFDNDLTGNEMGAWDLKEISLDQITMEGNIE